MLLMPLLKLLNSCLVLIILLILYPSDYFPQVKQSHFDCLSIEQGLPSNSANCIYQDKKGFIWIGTNNGLARYDGYECKVYRHDPKDVNSISSDVVASILEDSAGNFWVGTLRGGLNKFDRY